MLPTLKVLLVEDSEADAALALRALERAGLRCEGLRVETPADFRRELAAFAPKIILSDFSMPRFDGLAALVQGTLAENPFSGHVFVFRGRAGDRVKVLWWDGSGLCLFAKRLERGRFIWPQASSGVVQSTRMSVTSRSPMVPIPFCTVQTCSGLIGWDSTRTS